MRKLSVHGDWDIHIKYNLFGTHADGETTGVDGATFEDLLSLDERTDDFDEFEAVEDGSLAKLFLDFECRFDSFLDFVPVRVLFSSSDPIPFSSTTSFEERSLVDLEYLTSLFCSLPIPTLCFRTFEALIKLTKRFNNEKGVFLARIGADIELSEDEVT